MLYSYLLMRNLNQSAKALVFINFNTVSLTATGFLVPYSAAVGVLPPGGAFALPDRTRPPNRPDVQDMRRKPRDNSYHV